MKKLIAFIAVLAALALTVTALAVPIFAETVYEHDGILYTKVSSYFVSVYGCSEELTELVIPNYVDEGYISEIGDYAMQNNTSITYLDLSKAAHLNKLGQMCFNGCTSLSGRLYVPYLVTDVRLGAFQECSSLESVSYSARTSVIPEQCFNRCYSLSKVTMSESVTTIEKMAFANCPNLSYIYIPDSVTDIHYTAFYYDDSLVIYCNSGSYAQSFAIERGYDYVLLDAPQPTEPPTEAPTDPPTEPEPQGYLLGDTDGNEMVDVVDATWVQRAVAEMDTTPVEATLMQGNVDGDDGLTVIDATFIMRYNVSIATPYPIGERIV